VASGVIGAWVGNVSGGLGHNYRRAIEAGIPQKVTIEDYSNFTLGMALTAGAYGMPYIPVRSILGSDITKSNPNFRLACDPFTNQPVIQVPPLKPDVAVFSVQRADNNGNCHHWGSAGVMQEAGMAAKKIILLADEIVEHEVIASDPSRVPFPGFLVTAVVHEPSGQHPSPMTGTWKRDNQFFNDYHAQSRDRVGFAAWLDEWVFACSDHGAYRAKLGEKLEELRIHGQALAAPANYAAK
jgi:glutaconate CoA-transferase subunit A